MLTSNYWYLRQAIDGGNTFKYANSGTQAKDIGLIDENGSSTKIFAVAGSSGTNNMISNTAMRKDLSVKIGTGNTNPTSNDYNVDQNVPEGITFTYSILNSLDNFINKTVASVSVVNATNNDVVIREYALFKKIYMNTSDRANIMLFRQLLDNPITVPALNSTVFSFTWDEYYS